MCSPIRGGFNCLTDACSLYRQSGLQYLVRQNRVLKRIAPRMAAAEALMPEVRFEPGVVRRQPLSRRRKEAGNRRLLFGLCYELHAGRHQPFFRPAAHMPRVTTLLFLAPRSVAERSPTTPGYAIRREHGSRRISLHSRSRQLTPSLLMQRDAARC